MALLENGWFIIFLVIAFIGGNLAALRATANLKFPQGKSYSRTDSLTNSRETMPTENVPPMLSGSPSAQVSAPLQNVNATQQQKTQRKQDHNHSNERA